MAADAAIEAWGLTLCVGGRRLLDELSFQVAFGECVAVLGPNGAGKTTLFKCLMRVGRRPQGRIVIGGAPLSGLSQRALARMVALVPQDDGRSAPYTVRELAALSRYPHLDAFATMSREDQRQVDLALERAGVAALAGRAFDTLSGGERQKVLIAAALAQQAPILLLDEPTTFLDPRRQRDIRALLRDLRREGRLTVLFSTHDLNHALESADRVLALDGGRLVFDGSTTEFAQEHRLNALYDCEFRLISDPNRARPWIVAIEGADYAPSVGDQGESSSTVLP